MHNNLDVLQHDGRPAKSARIPRLDNDRGTPKRTRASREDVTLFGKKLKLDPTDRKSRNKASLELRRYKRSEAEQTDEQPQLHQLRDSRWPLDKIESGDLRSLALAFQQASKNFPTPSKRSVAFFKSGANAMMTRLSWINEYKYIHENPTLLPSLVHSGGSRHEPSRFQFSGPYGDCDAQESTEMRLQTHMRKCSQATSEPLRKDEWKPVSDQAGQSTSDEHDNFALGDDERSSPTTHQHFFFKCTAEQARNHDYKSNVEIWEFLLQPEEIVHVGSEAVDSNNKKLDSYTWYLIGSLEEMETLGETSIDQRQVAGHV
ncbi:hypothetical protein CEP51_003848 [Fusarium floridanum]|uniref:Uncharacterized protein n=1 Tax=Fusarium floridanum TaxID=1325733 RepID=A0A428S3W8_9HYPO|nr:hypothetical protein CEP51_003848 [Fusarium floridanum]